MAVTKVVMPKLSDAMESGKIIKWLKKEGDRIQGGDILAEVETDKADVEMEAFAAGEEDRGADWGRSSAHPGVGTGRTDHPPGRRGRRLERRTGRRVACGRGGRRVRGSSAHADPGGDRSPDAAVEGAGPSLLRHERSGDGSRVAAARAAERAGGPAQALRQRPRDPGLRPGAPEAPGGERLAPGRRDPRVSSGAHR